MRLNILISLLLLSAPLTSFAQEQDFKVYYPKHRLPEELVKVATGLMPRATFTTMNSTVVISSDARGIKDALKLFKELDRAPRKFLVKFRADGNSMGQEDESGISGNMGAGPVKITKPKTKAGSTLSIGGIAATGDSRTTAGRSSSFQTVEVMEGSEAKIQWNGEVFVVRPRPLGNGNVQIDLNQGNGLTTSTPVPQNTWKNVGGISESKTGNQGEILGKSSQENSKQKDFQLFVQEVK